MYIDKLDDIVNKCNNTYHRTIKIKPVDVKPNTCILILIKKIIQKLPNLKLVLMLEYQNIKILNMKGYVLNWSEDVFVIKKVKGALSDQRQFLAAESPSKMMKNAFCFLSKALFVLQIFNFCLDFLVM